MENIKKTIMDKTYEKDGKTFLPCGASTRDCS